MASPAASANGSGGLDVAEVPQAHDAATVNNVGSVHQPMVHDVSDPHLTQASTVEVRSSSPTGPDNSQNNVQHHSQSALVPDATQAHHPQAPSNASANLKTPKAEIAGVNPSSPVAKPSWGHQLRNSFSNWWTWELLSVLISLLCFVGVIILLAVSDGRGVPQLGYRLTLNTIISILITASKSAMLVAVGTAIGQRNWSWMIRDRQRLLDIQIFDDASRGPWGAFTMLLSLRSRDIVALGAVVTILITILDPFAQQLVVYPIRTVTISDESVFVPQATVFREPRGNFNDIYQRAVNDGLWNGAPSWTVSCPNGNCTFPPFKSLSWCSQCIDATDLVTMAGRGMEIDFLHPPNVSGGLPSYTWAQADYDLTINTEQFEFDGPYSTYNAGEYIEDGTENLQTYLHVPISHVWDLWWSTSSGLLYKWDFSKEKNGRIGRLWNAGVTWDTLNSTTIASSRFRMQQYGEYAVRIEAGRVQTTTLDTEYGVFAGYVPSFNESLTSSSSMPVCWAGSYTNRTSAFANPTDRSLLPPGASFCDAGGDNTTICDVNTEYVFCDTDALRQAQMVTQVLVGNKSDISCLQGPESAFFSMNKTHNFVYAPNASQSSNPKKLSYIVPWYWRNYDEERYSSSAYSHALFGGNGSSLETTLENIAASLTVALQTAAGNDPNGARIQGQTAVFEAYVHVRWIWIIYPATILAMGVLFVGWTIVATSLTTRRCRGEPNIGYGKSLWKSSSLALIYHGPVNLAHEIRNDATTISAMEKMANQTTVRFDHGQMLIVED